MMIYDCLIVGSGMCGLTAANILRENGLKITVLDKGRGIGGRIATRRFSHNSTGEGAFDYGAQYFTVKDSRFKKWVDNWIDSGVVKKWSDGFLESDGNLKIDNIDRYIGTENMRQITKHMGEDLDIHQSSKVENFSRKDDMWKVNTEDGRAFYSKVLLLTPPVPQSLELLSNSNIVISQKLKLKLEAMEYDPCIAILALCSEPTNIESPGGVWGNGKNISWISDNSKKGIKTDAVSLTVHTSSNFSKKYWNENNESIFNALRDEIDILSGADIVDYQIHKWLYSLPVRSYESTFAFTDKPGPVYFAGDAFCGGRVEGAFISGFEVSSHIASEHQF